jgi:hypothetical protein
MEFLNPWFMAAGGALVSAPILIHLINRMRFKRIRWAAMEFLLKSQKRNRRKLIIEQMILLLLRCALVLIVGLLLGWFLLGGDAGQAAFHLVVIDDTPSMGDRIIDPRTGKGSNSFEAGKDQVKRLADVLAQASTPQEMRVVLLSDPNTAVFPVNGPFAAQLDKNSGAALADVLKTRRPSALHIDPIQALAKAREVFASGQRGKKVLHFVSDFRERDWKTGPDAETLHKALNSLTATGAHVNLLDVAFAPRGVNEENIAPHPNLAVEELRPASTIAIEGTPLEFTVGVFNHSTEPKSTYFHVYTRSIFVNEKGQVDESDRLTENLQFTGAFSRPDAGAAGGDAQARTDVLPPGQLTEHKFELLLQKRQPPQEIKSTDPLEEKQRKRRADAEFVQVRVQIQDNPKDSGLEADNVRDAVVTLVRKSPVLVVDGAPETSRKINGDLWYLRRALDASVFYEMERCTLAQLDAITLDQYPDVYLVNVPEIASKDTIQKLADYVARGGSVAYFLGDKTQTSFYNQVFNNNLLADKDKLFTLPVGASREQHLFPVLLEKDLPPSMSADEMEDRLQHDKQPKILFPDETHPIVRGHPAAGDEKGGLVQNESALRYLMINRYWRCQPRSTWDPEPYQSQEVVVLPNRNSIDQYKRTAQDDMKKVLELTGELARQDKKLEPYIDRLNALKSRMTDALNSHYLDDLIRVLDDLMHDPGVKDDASRPNMPELWAHPEMRALKDEIDALRATLQFGDPLVVTRSYGKGQVLAFLTTPGASPRGLPPVVWNDWAGGVSGWTFPVFVKQMQEYMIRTSEQRVRLLGTDLALPELDAQRYENKVRRIYTPQPSPFAKAGDVSADEPKAEDDPLETFGPKGAQVFRPALTNVDKPGVYTFAFTPKSALNEPTTQELQAYAFNIDTEAESTLNRAPKEALAPKAANAASVNGGRLTLRSVGDSFDEFKDPPPELSKMVWLILLIGLIFVAEQALAVHLSFHLKENEAAMLAAPPAPRQTTAA